MLHTLTILTIVTALGCAATPASTAPATQPADTNATRPATATAPVSNEVATWLERIEQRANELDTLRAKLRYERVQSLLGDRQIRFGTLVYDAGPPARFAATFDRVVVDGQLQMQDHAFIFDGQWLAERIGHDKVFIRRELVPPDQQGQDLLKLGEGPFALPLDLRKDTVLERFDVTIVDEPAEDEALEGTLHLRLTPRPHVQIDQSQIDMWYDRQTLLPVQVQTVEEEAGSASIIRLREVEPGAEIPEGTFDTTPPQEPGWQVEVQPAG